MSDEGAASPNRVYGADGLAAAGFDPDRDLGPPGSPPFTRGIESDLYAETPWIMGMYSGFTSARDTNERFRRLIATGQTGFSVALDLPTQMGISSDHPLAAGEVGRVGVPLNSLDDMTALLEGIDLPDVRQIRTTANAVGPIFAAMVIVAAEEQGIDPGTLRIMIQNDPLKEYVARGAYIFPPEQGMRFACDLVEYATEHLPRWEPIEYCGYHVRDSGCLPHHELGITMANAVAYLTELERRDVDLERVCSHSVLFLSADVRVFEEAAKFRAARRMWSRLVEERFGVPASGSAVKIFCYTLGGSLTMQEPLNNVVRVSYQALAAALGGVQTLATSSYDEALGLPSDEAVQVALRTQQILAYETDAIDAIDPLGGSYFVESLTSRLERDATEVVTAIDTCGGSIAAIEQGFLQTLIGDASYAAIQAIDSGKQTRVGVNRFVRDPPDPANVPDFEGRDGSADALASLSKLRRDRDGRAVQTALADLDEVAQSDRNTMPTVINAVRARATTGEICDVLRRRWGRHVPARL